MACVCSKSFKNLPKVDLQPTGPPLHPVTLLAGHVEICPPQTSPQHQDPHAFLVWFSLKRRQVHVDRRVVGWRAGCDVDHPCGGQISPWPARKVTDSLVVFNSFCSKSKENSIRANVLSLPSSHPLAKHRLDALKENMPHRHTPWQTSWGPGWCCTKWGVVKILWWPWLEAQKPAQNPEISKNTAFTQTCSNSSRELSLLPCDTSQEPNGSCSEKNSFWWNFFVLGGFFSGGFSSSWTDLFHADFGKEFPSRTSRRGASWSCPSPSSALYPFLYRTEHFSRGEKGANVPRKERKRGGQQRGQKGKKDARKQVSEW